MTRRTRCRRAAVTLMIAFACAVGSWAGFSAGPAEARAAALQSAGTSLTSATPEDVFEDHRPPPHAYQNAHGRLRCAAADHRPDREPLSVAAPHLDLPRAHCAVRPRGFDRRPRHTAERTAADTVTHLQAFLR